ncbi:MAG: DUF732 domain-containing protein [Mycobacteriaceae bacterium]|nr:DUF732 domain-containing protein [Mycobacteriaceae bacterium]
MVHTRQIIKASVATCALAASVAVWCAAPAAAGDSSYLRLLQDKYSFLSAQQLLAEGHKVCDVLDRGVSSSTAVNMVSKDLAASLEVSDDIVAAAADELGC